MAAMARFIYFKPTAMEFGSRLQGLSLGRSLNTTGLVMQSPSVAMHSWSAHATATVTRRDRAWRISLDSRSTNDENTRFARLLTQRSVRCELLQLPSTWPTARTAIDLEVSANLINGSFTKRGNGTLRLSGTNTFAGGATVSGGTLLAGSNSALGSGTLTVNGGTADLGTFSAGVALVNLTAGSLVWTGNLTVGTGGLLGANPTIAANQTVSLSGTTTIDPAHTLTLNGGTLNTGAVAGTGTFSFINGTLGITGAAGLTVGSGSLLGTTVSLAQEIT